MISTALSRRLAALRRRQPAGPAPEPEVTVGALQSLSTALIVQRLTGINELFEILREHGYSIDTSIHDIPASDRRTIAEQIKDKLR